MDEQLKDLLEGINAIKNDLEETKKVLDDTKNELNERIEKGQEETKREMQKCLENLAGIRNKNKIAPVSAFPEPVIASPVPVSTFTVPVETVDPMMEKRTGKGEADEVLQTLPDTKRLNLKSLYNALDLRFGQKYSKDYARLQMKSRLQKTGISL
ncbi:hypothetical protein TNCV_3115781 [Trichonephila clavipes]|nr:hypothetical protein TNCV_3115781 [Trichonephila clavipes]